MSPTDRGPSCPGRAGKEGGDFRGVVFPLRGISATADKDMGRPRILADGASEQATSPPQLWASPPPAWKGVRKTHPDGPGSRSRSRGWSLGLSWPSTG